MASLSTALSLPSLVGPPWTMQRAGMAGRRRTAGEDGGGAGGGGGIGGEPVVTISWASGGSPSSGRTSGGSGALAPVAAIPAAG